MTGEAPPAQASAGRQAVSLCDLLDRLLETGVVVSGDITIALAGVELVTLVLEIALTSPEEAGRVTLHLREGQTR
jgi:hypothetical protein